MPRFVILEHDHPELHWDLLLEAGGVLQTWRLAHAPEVGSQPIEASALGDHRILYLDYEGPVSGNRGVVKRWDAGIFVEEPESLPVARRLILQGARVRGRMLLERIEGTNWRFLWLQPWDRIPILSLGGEK
jgi:DNA polymerase Ligase (LigD)